MFQRLVEGAYDSTYPKFPLAGHYTDESFPFYHVDKIVYRHPGGKRLDSYIILKLLEVTYHHE